MRERIGRTGVYGNKAAQRPSVHRVRCVKNSRHRGRCSSSLLCLSRAQHPSLLALVNLRLTSLSCFSPRCRAPRLAPLAYPPLIARVLVDDVAQTSFRHLFLCSGARENLALANHYPTRLVRGLRRPYVSQRSKPRSAPLLPTGLLRPLRGIHSHTHIRSSDQFTRHESPSLRSSRGGMSMLLLSLAGVVSRLCDLTPCLARNVARLFRTHTHSSCKRTTFTWPTRW